MYLLDANIFIQAKNHHYAFDVVPGFWRWLERAHGIGIAGSVERVREELLVGKDELADWARTHSSFFQPIDDDTAACFRPLLEWASSAPVRDGGACSHPRPRRSVSSMRSKRLEHAREGD